MDSNCSTMVDGKKNGVGVKETAKKVFDVFSGKRTRKLSGGVRKYRKVFKRIG